MNHEQWEALKAATQGHTLGPWIGRGFNHVWGKYEDATLAAAAPDLLAEVERLRGWMEWLLGADDYNAADACREMCQDALNGAEVPE